MKRNNVAKKLGIASLCLATAISAFSGITSFANDSVVLAEDTGTVAATDFFDTTVAKESITHESVAYIPATNSTTETSGYGVRLSSDAGYTATFKHTFYGNSTLTFRFPESYDGTIYGDFKLRISDAADESEYFDVIYYVNHASKNVTSAYVDYKGAARMIGAKAADTTKYTYKVTGKENFRFAPSFFGKGTRTTRVGKLVLSWTNDVLSVQLNTNQNQNGSTMKTLAQFGTTSAASDGSTWALPKVTFPNGYKVTVSSYADTAIEDIPEQNATDVIFLNVTNNETYKFNVAPDTENPLTFSANNYTKTYAAMAENEGKTLLGWKDAAGALYPTATALASDDITAYEPVFLGFDKIYGASVRIDTVTNNSGLRFITGFNPDDYAALLETGYITSFGTLVAYTDALDLRNFTAENYATELAAETDKKIVQVAQGSEGGQTFAYTAPVRDSEGNILTDDNGDVITKDYTAYSVALVGLTNFTQSYSARGYIVVTYADSTTATLYTPYVAGADSRSIALTAYNLKTKGAAEYNTYTAAQKGIVDGYIPEGFETAE